MQFAKHLRESVKQGDITRSVRIWLRPRVKVGGRYGLEEGYIVIDKITHIDWDDITIEHARESGFEDVDDLLKTAKHGRGENVYVVDFHYVEDDDYFDQ